MMRTFAATSASATSCAASAGTASTPAMMFFSTTVSRRPAMPSTRTPPSVRPIADGSRSKIAAMFEAMVDEHRRPGNRATEASGTDQGDVVLARGAQDAPDLADQRVDVVADPALAELAEAREVAPDLVALTCVYSAMSWDEIDDRPIFFACVRTCRYRERRAATPTVRRLDTVCDCSRLAPRTGQHAPLVRYEALPARRACAASIRRSNAPGRTWIDECPLAVDLHDGDALRCSASRARDPGRCRRPEAGTLAGARRARGRPWHRRRARTREPRRRRRRPRRSLPDGERQHALADDGIDRRRVDHSR